MNQDAFVGCMAFLVMAGVTATYIRSIFDEENRGRHIVYRIWCDVLSVIFGCLPPLWLFVIPLVLRDGFASPE